MILPFNNQNCLIRSRDGDPELRLLADRHYSRHRIGAAKFLGPARNLVLRDCNGDVLFGWMWPKDGIRWDGQTGFYCAIFRNESPRLSSEIILEAEHHAVVLWGPNRAFTFIDATKIKSANPGYCFKMAGWTNAGTTQSGKIILEKFLKAGEAMTTGEDTKGTTRQRKIS